MAETFDDVLMVVDFWDAPLSGVTTFDGGFCSFQRVYDEEGQAWSSSFMLQPLSGEELARFNEFDSIFNAWRAAYDKGNTAPHPLTPEATGAAADRYKVLHRAIDGILHTETARTIRCEGKISKNADGARYRVQWQKS